MYFLQKLKYTTSKRVVVYCKIIVLSDFGEIVKTEWNKSFEIRTELICDEYIIMPNHLHAIVVINKQDKNIDEIVETNVQNGETQDRIIKTHRPIVETHGPRWFGAGCASLRARQGIVNQVYHRKPKSISSFMSGFNSGANTN